MKKSFLFSMAAIAGMLFASGCSQDMDSLYTGNGEETEVSFMLNAPAELGSRGAANGKRLKPGDGMTVGRVVCAVFDASGNEISHLRDTVTMTAKQAVFSTRLVKGQAYKIVCFAYSNAQAFNFADMTNIGISYPQSCNDETLDAFAGQADIATAEWASGSVQKTITLKRPFAQLNIASSEADWTAATAQGYTTGLQSEVTVTNVYTAFNAYANEVTGSIAPPVTFNMASAVNDVVTVNGVDYHYVALGYFLAGDANSQQSLTDVTLTWQSAGTPVVHTYANVPVQRNYRTNILGAIFTNPVDVNIIVDESFDGDHNNELDENGFVSVMNIANTEELLSAIAHAVPGRMLTLKLAAGTYPAVLSITQSKMITLVPEVAGSTVVIAGIDGQANGNNSGTLVAEGITFDNSLQTTGWFTGTGQNIYPCVGVWGGNYTFSNCRFIVDGSAGKETGVMSWWLTEKTYMTFNACTFEGNASGTPAEARAMQIYDNVELVVDGCTFLTAKRYSLKYVGKNSKGVFKNNTISNASTCFVELGSATYPGANYSAQFYNNTLASGIAEYVVADATGLTAATLVTNETELVSGTASGEPVALSKNLSVSAANSVNGVTIGYGSNKASLLLNGGLLDGQGYTLTTSFANSTFDCAINCKGGTIKNLTIKGGFRGLFVNNPASDIVLDNVTFVNNCYTINVNEDAAVADTYELKVSNSTLDGWTSFAGKLKQATFTNCSFGRGKGGYTYADLVPYIPTVIKNCAFCEGFSLWADEIEGYTGNGQTYSRSDIVLKNCTVGGVLVTADNVETLFGGSPQGVSVQND